MPTPICVWPASTARTCWSRRRMLAAEPVFARFRYASSSVAGMYVAAHCLQVGCVQAQAVASSVRAVRRVVSIRFPPLHAVLFERGEDTLFAEGDAAQT